MQGGVALDGWFYIDVFDETNTEWQRFQALWPDAPAISGAALFDMARLVTLGLVHAPTQDRAGMRVGLERIKRVPAAIGEPGTMAGFGQWKRSALEGGYLVLRQWQDGQSVRVS
jgi:ABC-type branched-subunit amino acid transport system substrate-binding protein